jgi:hypothetical protein
MISEAMNTSIKRFDDPGLGRCAVCGQWRLLEMWDDGLNGSFCADCFDQVVDAEEFLTSQGLVHPEIKRPEQAS